jgi:hypothetical protein
MQHKLLLACLDDDADIVNAILDEAHRQPGGLQGLLAQLAAGCWLHRIVDRHRRGGRRTQDAVHGLARRLDAEVTVSPAATRLEVPTQADRRPSIDPRSATTPPG